MRKIKPKPIIVHFSITLLIIQVGCAHVEPLPEQVRAKLRTIGVVSARYTPETSFSVFPKGKGAGASAGAVTGAAAGFTTVSPLLGATCVGLPSVCGPLLVLQLAVIASATFLGALGGAAAGTEAAVPSALAEDTETKLQDAYVYLNVQETMRENVLEVARAETPYNFVPLTGEGPTAPSDSLAGDQEVSYSTLVDKGIDAVLEVSVRKIYTTSCWGKEPVLSLNMDVGVRLVLTSDDGRYYSRKFRYHSQVRKLAEWSEDNAFLFRQEFGQAYRKLAERIVDKFFLVYPPLHRSYSS